MFPVIDSIEVTFTGNDIHNPECTFGFFEKMYQLEQNKSGKINIVHIGDSHIQMICSRLKFTQFQKCIGNGGFGFTFPYSVAKTNNSAQFVIQPQEIFKVFEIYILMLIVLLVLSGFLWKRLQRFCDSIECKRCTILFHKIEKSLRLKMLIYLMFRFLIKILSLNEKFRKNHSQSKTR